MMGYLRSAHGARTSNCDRMLSQDIAIPLIVRYSISILWGILFFHSIVLWYGSKCLRLSR
jgi:hypothetical protein